MHLIKFDHDYSRRLFLRQLGLGVLSTGVLMPLWRAIAAEGVITKAYPDELLSIESYTRGAISPGNYVTADNLELVKDLLDPIMYRQVSDMGRTLRVRSTTTDVYQLSPYDYLEATLRHQGMARFSADGNIVTQSGRPWIGGNPFPDPKSAVEVFAGITLSWGRHDASIYAVKEYDLDPQGQLNYSYQSCWVEMSPVGRTTLLPKPYLPGHENKLRYQSVFFTSPNDVKGTSYLNIWPYDQNKFPELYGYLPAFKRVRRFPNNQRFEPLVPGSTLYLSDAWAAGDPLLTWGNYRIVDRGPMLAAVAGTWNSQDPNWQHKTHGGEHGQTFWDSEVELVPEVIVVEAEPIAYPRAPVGKKRVWFDARTLLPLSMVSYDRQGKIFRHFDGAYSLYANGEKQVKDGQHPYWSWTRLHAYNIQTNRMTRLEQVKQIPGGFYTQVNSPDVLDRYLTRSALLRMGR